MAKKAEVIEQVAPGEVEEPVAEAPSKTLSQEEVDTLILAARETARKEEFNRLNSIMSEQGAELKRLKEQSVQPPSTPRMGSKTLEVLVEDMKARQTDYGESNPRIAMLEAEIAQVKQQEAEETQRKIRQIQEAVAGYQRRTETLGLSETDEEYWELRDLVTEGKYQRAEIKLKKLEAAKVKPKEEAVVDASPFISEEAKRKWMEEHGLLESEAGLPSGVGGKRTFTVAEIEAMSTDEYAKIKPEVDKARREGRIKQ